MLRELRNSKKQSDQSNSGHPVWTDSHTDKIVIFLCKMQKITALQTALHTALHIALHTALYTALYTALHIALHTAKHQFQEPEIDMKCQFVLLGLETEIMGERNYRVFTNEGAKV